MAATEKPQDYIKRILAFVESEDPWKVLETTPRRIRELISGRSAAELARRQDPLRWSVAEILAHLADAEVAGAWRFRSVLAADGVPLQPFDQNDWASAFRYAEVDPFESLQLFEANRSGTLSLLKRVDRKLYAN